MVDLSKLSAVNRTPQAQSNYTPRMQMTVQEQINLEKMYSGKKVTKADMERALNEPSGAKVVKTLFEKSPLGAKFPENGNFEGYLPAYMTDEEGASFYKSNDGGLIRVVDGGADSLNGEEDRTKFVTYTKGNYTQEMRYDENGNLMTGRMEFKDEYGSTEKILIISKLQNGKFEVLTYIHDQHNFEECEL